MSQNDKDEQLIVPSAIDLKKELFQKEESVSTEEQQIVQSANAFVQSLLSMEMDHIKNQQQTVAQVESIGVDVQRESAKQMDLLKQPISTLSRRAQDGGDVANALVNLKMTVESLDPEQINFNPGWFSRILGYIPGIGTPIKRYLTKFESAQTVIAAIVKSLEMGRDQLLRDNVTLKEDQTQLWESEKKLEKIITYATQVDKHLDDNKIALNAEPARVKFIEEYLQFPVRQRLIDLQQQLAVQQQTVIASEIIIRNNKELARGVNRALNVTITALQNATTIAMALAHQEKVLQKVNVINETTSKLITDSAARLKTQGTQIHKQAASAQLDVNALKTALKDLNIALDDISNFRQQALPGMATVISDLDRLIKDTAEPLRRIKKLDE